MYTERIGIETRTVAVPETGCVKTEIVLPRPGGGRVVIGCRFEYRLDTIAFCFRDADDGGPSHEAAPIPPSGVYDVAWRWRPDTYRGDPNGHHLDCYLGGVRIWVLFLHARGWAHLDNVEGAGLSEDGRYTRAEIEAALGLPSLPACGL